MTFSNALSNPEDILDFINGITQAAAQGNDAHHFDAARFGTEADKLIQTIVTWLQNQGVKN